METQLNAQVTSFLDELNHPIRNGIESLRKIILNADGGLSENIKWNGPNYHRNGEDRITMKIHPPKQVQLIFHRGAKVQEQPEEKLINDPSKLLTWKGTDRAFASFKTAEDVEGSRAALGQLIKDWIKATT